MTTFTIDNDNNITAFATPEEAAATTAIPFDTFASQQELAQLVAGWPPERLVAIWNSLPGVTPVKRFKSADVAAGRIWERIQNLGAPETSESDKPKPEGDDSAKTVAEKPKAGKSAKGGAQAAKGAPAKGKATKKTTPAKKAPKAKKAAKSDESAGPREGSKTARVVAMMQRKDGATLAEIMEQMGWQKHTVRGFMAGAMKKAGYKVESFKSDKGERSYRINQ